MQARLPGASFVEETTTKPEGNKIYANNMVRVSADTQKIDKFFHTVTKPPENNLQTENKQEDDESVIDDSTESVENHQQDAENEQNDEEMREKVIQSITEQKEDNLLLDESLIQEPSEIVTKMPEKWKAHAPVAQANVSYIDPKESFKTRTFKYERVETKLTSVKQLRMKVESNCNINLREILANLIFIGSVSLQQSLIQNSTKLYLCDTVRLMYVNKFCSSLSAFFRPLVVLRLS